MRMDAFVNGQMEEIPAERIQALFGKKILENLLILESHKAEKYHFTNKPPISIFYYQMFSVKLPQLK